MARAPRLPALPKGTGKGIAKGFRKGLPPSPVWLRDWVPEKYRRYAFLPLALGLGFLVFGIVGLTVQEFLAAFVAGIVLGPVLAYGALGPPLTRAEVAKAQARLPRLPPERRAFLFFPAAILAAAVFYFLAGLALTTLPLDEDLLVLPALLLAVPAAIAVAFLLYGFPRPRRGLRGLRSPLELVPEEKRPFLFFPLGLVFAAPLYLLLGLLLTEFLVPSVAGQPGLLDPDPVASLALLGAVALGFAASYRLVGVPRASAIRERLRVPEVPERARPAAFVAFVVVVGSLLALVLGGTLGALDAFAGEAALDLAFPLFLLAGWLLAAPLAGKLFGYPVPRKPLRAYVPALGREHRAAALLPLTIALGLAFTLLLGLALGRVPFADLEDAYLDALLAFPLAFLVALRLLRVRARELDPRALEALPERAKPAVVVALTLLAGTLLFTAVGQVLTGFLAAAAVSYGLGLALALALVERSGLAPALGRRAERRRREREIEARLRREMGLAPEPRPAAPAKRRARPRLGGMRKA